MKPRRLYLILCLSFLAEGARWHSDVMLRYQHVQSVPVLQNFARAMNLHGHLQALPDAGTFIHKPAQL
jgi:hypothetical protein